MRCSAQPRYTENVLKKMAFCQLQKNVVINMVKRRYCHKNRYRCCKNCFQKGSSKNCRSYKRFNWKQQAKQKVKKKKMKQKKTRGLHTTREKTASNRLFKIASDTKQKRHTKKLQT